MPSPSRALLASPLVFAAAIACSSSSSSAAVAQGPYVYGTYEATTEGSVAAITFYLENQYVLYTPGCAGAGDAGGAGGGDAAIGDGGDLGDAAIGDGGGSLDGGETADTCAEYGTYAIGSSGTTLTLTPTSGPPRTLPFSSDEVSDLPVTLSSDVGGDGLHVLGNSLTGGADGGTSLTNTKDGGINLLACTNVPLNGGEGGTPTARVTTQFHMGPQTLKGGTSPSSQPNPTNGWSCSGSYNKKVSLTGAYYITDFGCSSGFAGDPGDNCCAGGSVSAYSQGLCPSIKTKPASNCSNACASSNSCNSWRAGTSGKKPTAAEAANFGCEEEVKYFTTGAPVWGGVGTRICLTTADKKKSVVVAVYDSGPACSVERRAGAFLLDVSPAVSTALYGGSQYNASDKKMVFVSPVAANSKLGGSCPQICAGLDAGM